MHQHLPAHHGHPAFYHRPDIIDEPLYVICPIFNSQRYRTRWKLYGQFAHHAIESGAKLILVECAFGERNRVFTEPIHENHSIIHLRTSHELWLKENMINLAIQRLPEDWKYVAWIDPDILFTRKDWVGETIHLLQHYKFVQMFSVAQDIGPNFEPLGQHYGFAYSYLNGLAGSTRYERWHPGFCWATTHEAFNQVGGLIDFAILGSADRHMAAALIGKVKTSVNHSIHKRYLELLLEWQARAERYIMRNIGYMDGLILHYWHGHKKHRKYKERWKILVDNNFNPDLDLKKDSQGLLQLTHRRYQLRDEVRDYFRERNEDSIDV